MNICKERLNNRTKSLREKFSRNPLNLTTIPLQSTTVIGSSASGFDPSTASTTLINQIDRPFLWQHDVAIQCNLIQAPELLNVAKKLPALINVAAAKLRNITDHHSYSDGLNQQSTNLMITQPEKLIKNENTSAGGGYVGRFWKSTMSVTFNSQQNHSGPTSPFPTLNSGKKSTFRWTTSVRRNKHQQQREQQQNRQPILKRAASFNDNSGTGYARLVQSTSSPSSPELIHDERNNNNNNRLNILDLKPKLIRPTALFNITNENNNNDGNNKKLMKIKSITTEKKVKILILFIKLFFYKITFYKVSCI
uniref:Homeobox protein 13-like n=1 Tax=Dermatophagoides pteronyssinus TaxID=6956 RepID=A0A6P6XUU1_DERPT|nr:homeobox protein 13-like [Dermatophagoides pteronyssinus]